METGNKQKPPRLLTVAKQVATRVEQAMRHDLEDALQGCDPLLAEILEYALFGGGKRIRPLLAVLSTALCGRSDEDVYLLAAALEYLHVATLVHDDVIDHAQQRRGRATVGKKYGMARAILVGDWLHARSMYLVGRLTGPPGLSVFCRATTAMVDGEFLQLRHSGDPGVGEKEYFAVIDRKTGRLISSTCALGALFAGGDSKQQRDLAEYGDKVGTAFQIVDDLLDYLGDQRQTGKALGNDFLEGKVTLPLILAMKQLNPVARQEMTALIKGDRAAPETYNRLFELVLEGDGFHLARERAEQLVREAVALLQPFAEGVDPDAYEMLVDIAGYVLAREK